MKAIIFLLFLSPFIGLAQSEQSEELSDTSLAVGILSEDAFAGKAIGSYCFSSPDKYLKRGTTVIISGAEVCQQLSTGTRKEFFEILFNHKFYLIEKENLVTRPTYFTQLEKMSVESKLAFRKKAEDVSRILQINNANMIVKYFESCKSYGLSILDWGPFDESEYTDGTGVKIKIYNPTNKTIKYVWFVLVGINPVGDQVGTAVTRKGVGPIEPGSSGTYEYSYVWFTDLVETARISSIKIQYMDGSFKTILKPRDVIMNNELYEILLEEED